MDEMRTLTQIAKELDVQRHRVRYVVQTRPHIKAAHRIGQTDLYAPETVREIKREVKRALMFGSHRPQNLACV